MRMLDYVKLANPRMRENAARGEELVSSLVDAYVGAGAPSVRIVACGSSRNASFCARDLMQEVLRTSVAIVTPEAYVKFDHAQPSDAFEVFVSQSGYSTNTLAALDFARSLGRSAIALTGNPTAPVREHADLVIDWGVGVESVDFVTMGVQTLVEFLTLFALYAAHAIGRLDDAALAAGLADLEAAIDAHAGALEVTAAFMVAQRRELVRNTPTIVVGSGPLYGVAMEACLKLNECLKRPAMMYEPEEFVHGPEMQIDPRYQLFLLEDAQGDERTAALADAFSQVCATTLVSFLPNREGEGPSPLLLPPVSNPLMAAIPALVPFQWMCAQLMDELRCEDVHPLLEAQADRMNTKAVGYADAIHALEAQAAERYGA